MGSDKKKQSNSEGFDELKYAQLINRFTEDLLSKNTVNEIAWNVCNNVISYLKLEDCVLYVRDDDYLIKKAAANNQDIEEEDLLKFVKKLKIGEGLVGNAAKHKKTIVLKDATKEKKYISDGISRNSELVVPIISDNEIIGVLDSEHSNKNFFNAHHIKIFEHLASLLAIKIVQAQRIEKLLARQIHMDMIYNNSNDLLFLMAVEPNDEYRCISINQSYLNMIGQTWSNMIGRTLSEIWGEEKSNFFKSKYKEAIASKSSLTYEVTYENVEPAVIAETTIMPIFDSGGNCINISGVSRNITESKKSERVILESEHRYRTLFENSLDGIYKSTPEGKFVNVNPALVNMLGYDTKQELLDIDIKTDLYFKIEDRIIMASHEEDQYVLKKKDGTVLWVEDHSYYEYDDQDEIIFHHGILRDVTTKIEKQKELEILVRVTEEQNGRLQNFAHIVSHNIRSHSANMTSLVHFMERTKNEKDKAKLFGMLKTSTEKLEETIQNLSEIITVNQGMEESSELRNLNQEINNTLKILSGDIRENQVKVDINVPSSKVVKIIPAYLDSILLNILSNAIKYRSPDRLPKIKISTAQKDNYLILSIEDNGQGIDIKKNEDKLFGMYQTFHDNEDSRGFGLYITKNQVEAMKGKIEVESKLGKGTTFRIFFNEEN